MSGGDIGRYLIGEIWLHFYPKCLKSHEFWSLKLILIVWHILIKIINTAMEVGISRGTQDRCSACPCMSRALAVPHSCLPYEPAPLKVRQILNFVFFLLHGMIFDLFHCSIWKPMGFALQNRSKGCECTESDRESPCTERSPNKIFRNITRK